MMPLFFGWTIPLRCSYKETPSEVQWSTIFLIIFLLLLIIMNDFMLSASDAICLFHIPWFCSSRSNKGFIDLSTDYAVLFLCCLLLWISADFDYVGLMPAVSGGFSRQIQKGKSRTIGSLLFNTDVCQHSLISFHCLNLSSSLSTESCTGQDLADLGDRLRDWFQLLQGNGKQNSSGNPVASSASSEALTSMYITESSLLYTHNTTNAVHLHLYIVFYIVLLNMDLW